MKTLEDVLRQLKNDAEAMEAMARGHRAGSVAAARYQGDATGIRHAVAEIEAEIQREADRIVEAEPGVLIEWPVTLPKGRWVYHLSLTWNAAVENVKIVGEFRTESGVIWFDDGDGGVFTESDFSSGDRFVKVETTE